MAPVAVAGDLSTIGAEQYKLNIPVDCLRAAGWPTDPGPPLAVVAELLEPGRIRLYLEKNIQSKLDELRAQIVESDVANREELLAVLNDRYRIVKFYTKTEGKPVILKVQIVVYLAIAPEDARQVWVEGKRETVDIMSLGYRNRRLDRLKGETSV